LGHNFEISDLKCKNKKKAGQNVTRLIFFTKSSFLFLRRLPHQPKRREDFSIHDRKMLI
jgi:hypothetical protein